MNDIIDPAPSTDSSDRPMPLASWTAPEWATRSRAEDGHVAHTRKATSVPTISDLVDHPAPDLTPEVVQLDQVEVWDGGVFITRGEPVVFVEGISLTLAAAHNLGAALQRLVEEVEAGR